MKHPIIDFGSNVRNQFYDLVYRTIENMDRYDHYGPISTWDTYFKYAGLHNGLVAPVGMLDHYIEFPPDIYVTMFHAFKE